MFYDVEEDDMSGRHQTRRPNGQTALDYIAAAGDSAARGSSTVVWVWFS
jgi:hypothetical protein